ncbi:uracil-xanthine permease family protein [Xanthobacter oligotrophicus]|uniref:uracil-xanthine permease family protein n=1 Tax=Xanthobacter oligotrophicus TaxID=2607286 RepID=UPI0011F17F0A|nr:solute carrier family 23 protein [Xanthobacter oligotrophicus]MCG5235903.1 xanthine permease [Xanthobacter oligotrophicus]
MSLRYDLQSRPPLAVLVTSIAQHMGLMAVTLVFPVLVAQAAGADATTQANYLALAMLAMGLSTLFQSWGGRLPGLPRIGSGFLLPAVFTAAYLPAALLTAKTGGLPAVAGLTIAAGLTQITLSRFISRLRPYLPIEIVGLVVVLIGIILGVVAFKLVVGLGQDRPLSVDGTGAAVLALAVMIGLAVWGTARLKTMAVLVGLAVGTAFHLAWGLADPTGASSADVGAPLTALAPSFASSLGWSLNWPLVVPSFSVGLLPGFLAGALACTLRGFGDMVASQRANDRDWKRPDYPNIEAGVLADGLGTLMAGLLGTMGLNTYSASVGLSVATQVLARRVALGVGFGWIALAFLPGASALVLAIPRGVLGAALLFASAFIVLSGVSILGQRMLDARRTITVGLGFLMGLSFDQLPTFYSEHLASELQSVVSSSLILGLFTALALNALFRIGRRTTLRTHWQPETGFSTLRPFLLDAGGVEGARADGVARLVQLTEEFSTAAPSLAAGAGVEVAATFDEHQLQLAFTWAGRPLEPGPPPSLDPDVDEDAVMNGIVLLMMTRLSDRLTRRVLADGRHELLCVVDQ